MTVIAAIDWYDVVGVRRAEVDGLADAEDWVWGVAYRIDPEREAEVRAYLGELGVVSDERSS